MRNILLSSIAVLCLVPACSGGATSTADTGGGVDSGSVLDTGGGGTDSGDVLDMGSSPDLGFIADSGRVSDGVRCFGAPADCEAGEVCCDDPTSGTMCVADGTACTGAAIACDGTEDCPSTTCCSDGNGTSCDAPCAGLHICHDASECGTGESCCPNGGGVPLGTLMHCTMLAPGASCPLPP